MLRGGKAAKDGQRGADGRCCRPRANSRNTLGRYVAREINAGDKRWQCAGG